MRKLSGSHGDEMTEISNGPAVYSNVTESGQEIVLPHIGTFRKNCRVWTSTLSSVKTLVMSDFSKAVDFINHNIDGKLLMLGVSPSHVQWVVEFLTDNNVNLRLQCDFSNNKKL